LINTTFTLVINLIYGVADIIDLMSSQLKKFGAQSFLGYTCSYFVIMIIIGIVGQSNLMICRDELMPLFGFNIFLTAIIGILIICTFKHIVEQQINMCEKIIFVVLWFGTVGINITLSYFNGNITSCVYRKSTPYFIFQSFFTVISVIATIIFCGTYMQHRNDVVETEDVEPFTI